MELHESGVYGGSPLDRLNNVRADPAFIRKVFFSPLATFLVVDPSGSRVLVRSGNVTSKESQETDGTTLLWLNISEVSDLFPGFEDVDFATDACVIFLGALRSTISIPELLDSSKHYNANSRDDYAGCTLHFAVRLPGGADMTLATQDQSQCFKSLRSIGAVLSYPEAAICAHALSLCKFHERHAFCGTCGSPTFSEHGGARRKCTNNRPSVGADDKSAFNHENLKIDEHADSSGQRAAAKPGNSDMVSSGRISTSCTGVWFPRIDPVAIMLIVDSTGTKCLMGRVGRHVTGMWSCLAGFMEHGERVEDTVRREVFEESGVLVSNRVRFFGSQPWPEPYSLMLGCIAQAKPGGEEIILDKKELEEARWFTVAEVVRLVEHARTLFRARVVPDKGALTAATDLYIPPESSIAGRMLAAFANRDPITVFSPACL